MEILFWLLPAAVLTVASMVWVAWWGRAGRGEVDRETAARRMGEALTREQRQRPGYAVTPREHDRTTGVALRASRMRPIVIHGEAEEPAAETPAETTGKAPDTADHDRRAS